MKYNYGFSHSQKDLNFCKKRTAKLDSATYKKTTTYNQVGLYHKFIRYFISEINKCHSEINRKKVKCIISSIKNIYKISATLIAMSLTRHKWKRTFLVLENVSTKNKT